jgi:hypothetical protein
VPYVHAASSRRSLLIIAGALSALFASGCGGDDSTSTTNASSGSNGSDLAGIKTYLLEHTTQLVTEASATRTGAQAYYEMATAVNFDYAKLLKTKRPEVQAFVKEAQATFGRANPAYEEMEGVVAGTPTLADFDVDIDAGSDGSDPESAVSFDITTPSGKVLKQPGNVNYLIETSVFGTEPKFAAPNVTPDLDGDGTVEFGEAVPDADVYLGAATEFEKQAKELDAAAKAWEPTESDAFTALVVMTPTMSEYFGAWKNSRFVAGAKAEEKAFVAASRLQDITDILEGLQLVYASVEPRIASVDPAQATQTKQRLDELTAFAAGLRDEEAGGRTFTAEEADSLGSEAQANAQEIAGQVSQAATRLNIRVEE